MTIEIENGLASAEVDEKIREYGYNEIPEKKSNSYLRIAKKFWGITPWMLELTAVLEWFLGKYLEVYVVLGLLAFNAILSFIQEERANAALELLREKLKIRARVKRDGRWTIIPARELVPGDLLRLRAGDFIPSDVKIEEGNVEVDQSSLTGESQSVRKQAGETLYSGSILRRGEITGTVVATGSKTYFGRTLELVQLAKPKLHMEEVTSRVVKSLLVIVCSFLAVALIVTAMRGVNLAGILPLAVVLMVSAIPVALPTMFAISMALGSLELVKEGVLITRLSAIEDAATMDIVCADKTGTMTLNRLSVEEEIAVNGYQEPDVILWASLASQEADQDPIDLAFLAAARKLSLPLEAYSQKRFVPFDPATRRTEALVEKEGKGCLVTKGALHTILPLCKAGEERPAEIEAQVADRSARGYRAIAVAQGPSLDALKLVGVAFLYDKPRPDSHQLIQELRALGVQVKMLTGDALPVAREIARELDLGENILRASDLKEGKGNQLSQLAEESAGFAEIYPEDKYLIVQTLQKGRHVVGMTGDGVTDAPALRQSEVGIAVSNATDVAKKAASAVLTTEGLEGIVDLVKIGRMTYQRIITWILNKIIKTFQITVFVVLAFLLTGSYVISALHMILLLFLTDFVTLSISTDRVRYSPKPDHWDITGLVKTALFLGILAIGELMLLLHIGYTYFGLSGHIDQLHTYTFQMLIFMELLDLLIIRERKRFWCSKPSRFLLSAVGIDLVLVFLISILGLPGVAPIAPAAALTVAAVTLVFVFLANDSLKVLLIRKLWPSV